MSDFNFNIIHIPVIDSTNSYAHKLLQEKKVQEGTIIRTDFQESGRGQFNKKWESEKGKNLLFSALYFSDMNVEQQFLISKFVALGVKDYLDSLSAGDVKIKWPNDILINRRKIAGILIENSIVGKRITTSIIGIGLNVNQTSFESYQRKATSLQLITGNVFDLQAVLEDLSEKIWSRYVQLKSKPILLEQEYLEGLYGHGITMKYKDSSGEFKAVIKGVSKSGQLQLYKNGRLEHYDLKEIEFLE